MVEIYNFDGLVEREGLYYEKFTKIPFSGKVTGQVQGSFKDGKKDGPWVAYHKDGTVDDARTGTYKDGEKVE
jgi:antitoxin component YwqK of YwqJK toxin-antitoxin module